MIWTCCLLMMMMDHSHLHAWANHAGHVEEPADDEQIHAWAGCESDSEPGRAVSVDGGESVAVVGVSEHAAPLTDAEIAHRSSYHFLRGCYATGVRTVARLLPSVGSSFAGDRTSEAVSLPAIADVGGDDEAPEAVGEGVLSRIARNKRCW